ncbi:MAG: SDR family NAD(P)-dependent oxidoreductase [Polyangiales bacterium]
MSDEYEVFETDIAIVGMAARLPGARNTQDYWKNLIEGVESVRSYTDEELLAAGESDERLRQKNYVRASAPMLDMELFDGDFFGFSPKDSAIMDPQHRHFLEVCWEALENAAHPPENFEGPIGMFAGCGMGSYLYFNLCSRPDLVRDVGLFLLRHTGNDKDFLATRASYLLNLTGPSINVQTACSTSLVATHLAVQSLLSRECDMALAGGVTIEFPHRRGYLYHEGEVLSPDGHCHAFDHRGQGTVFGSGAGVVVLRRLGDALDDGDIIHGVIRGSAVNNDGSRKVNYLAPSVEGQTACMVEAYGVADVDPRTIEYVECHGTGTYLGDPIEVQAMTEAFRAYTKDTNFCQIGSVKTNIGHLDTAAGVAALVKATLALKHGTIPATLGFEKPNPNIQFDTSPFRVASEKAEWPSPANHPRRAAVNSLGVGGTNAHVVLQEPPLPPEPDEAKRPVQLFTLSAKKGASLDGASERLAKHLRDNPEDNLADIAWTLHHGRRAFERRRVVAARSAAEAADLLEQKDSRRVFTHRAASRASTVFLCPGGGSQYPRMAADLYKDEPVFRAELERGLKLLREKHDIELEGFLFGDAGGDTDEARFEALAGMTLQLPAIFITSIAVARLFESWGVKPEVLLGHSVGENTAACLAGVMSYEDCLQLVVLRGRLVGSTEAGAMLSIGMSAAAIQGMLPECLDLAVINGPEACVVSGTPDDIDAFEKRLEEFDEIDVRRLSIPAAAHSRFLDPILAEFRAYLESIKLSKPQIPFLSNKSGGWITDEEATSPEYWTMHLRSTVRFADNVDTLLKDKTRVMIETGPGRTLSSLSRQHKDFLSGGHSAFPSIRHRNHEVDDVTFFTTALGQIWAAGGDFDWAKMWDGEQRSRVELPTYAFDHKHFFIERSEQRSAESSIDLRKLEDLSDWGSVPIWQPALAEASSVERHTWLIFMDGGGVGRRLRDRIKSRGDRVVCVYESDAFIARGDDEYALSPERGREGYASLIAELVKDGKTPDRIVHLWLLDATEGFRPGSSLAHHQQERGFFSLLFLAQALADESVAGGFHLNVVTNGMVRVQDGRGGGDESLAYPDKATVLGPVRVLPRELEGATASAIDVRLPRRNAQLFGGAWRMALADPFRGKKRLEEELDALAEELGEELDAKPKNAVVAFREGKRFEERIVPAPLKEASEIPVLQEGGTYLITGGLGGIGLEVAEFLASTCHARLVLIGRTLLPARDQWADWIRQHGAEDRVSRRLRRLLDIEAAGGQVLPVQADVTNVEEMRSALATAESHFGPVRGVVHAAGAVNDGLIAMKTLADVERVFAPKVQGTRVLWDVLQGEGQRPLDFLVLFSSTSTFTAAAGQVDYVGANAFLDAFAESHAGSPTRVTSLHWGVWNEVGMAAEGMGLAAGADEVKAGDAIGEQPTHPWLAARVRDSEGDAVLEALFSTKDWALDGHRTRSGQALLPGTAYLELTRAALRAHGEDASYEIEDLFFLRAFAVEEGNERKLRVKLRPTPRGYSFEVLGRIEQGGVGWVLHAQGHLALRRLERPAPLPIEAITARCTSDAQSDPAGIVTAQEKHLLFGPRWRVLRECAFGKNEGFARLSLAEKFAGETTSLGLHPALLDIATGWAMKLIEGYESDTLWVPVSYERVRVHADLSAKLVSWVRLSAPATAADEFASFDIVLADEFGNIALEVDRLSLRRLAGAPDFTARVAPREIRMEPREQELSPAEARLAANIARGILPKEGRETFARVLAGDRRPQVVVSSLSMAGLIEQASAPLAGASDDEGISLARPDLDSEYVEPRDEVERTLVSFWQELLGIDLVGVEDSFFDLGGHSLIAVRLFAKIKKAYQVEFPISVLFEAPTIEGCAALIKERAPGAADSAEGVVKTEAPRTRYEYLVPMHEGEGGPKTPFFLVAGMFGNVLNLRHLAHLVGTNRRFYGLQARGLYGDQEPHETFEEMASAYIEEIRTVQPRGPYFLGGFSGGGITAYEMAQQLEAAGEEVALLVMLDTPVPEPPASLSVQDRIAIQKHELAQKGAGYLAEWAVNRWHWEVGKLKKRFDDVSSEQPTDTFHDEAIEAAFRTALGRYTVRPWKGGIKLYRPKLPIAFDLGNGRLLNSQRDYVHEDNGWRPFVESVDIVEVPGDHDSMVLEPSVRVLARHIRGAIDDAESSRRTRALDTANETAS